VIDPEAGLSRAAAPIALVTGATGMVGPRVVECFASAGFQVRVLASRPRPDLFGPEIDVHIGDITDPGATRSAMPGVDAVVHLAARLHVMNGSRLDMAAYRRVNVDGTRNIVDAALDADVRRLVFFSTIAVYGPGRGEVWDESSPLDPDTPYGATKAEAERIVLTAVRRDGTPLGVVLRLAAVFGPNLKGNYLRLVRALAGGGFVPLGRGDNHRALINDRDVGAAALLAAAHPAAAGRVYNVSDGVEHSVASIVNAICDALGRRPPRLRVPLAPARAAAGVVEAVARLASARPPVSRAAIDKYTEDTRVDSGSIRRDLGFTPQADLRDGWRDAIVAMRRSGQL
jgi:UDP-glucose 4-epimerase